MFKWSIVYDATFEDVLAATPNYARKSWDETVSDQSRVLEQVFFFFLII